MYFYYYNRDYSELKYQFIYTIYKIRAIDVSRFVSVLRMPELNPHRLSSLPVRTKTRTTRLVYVSSSLGSVRIGGKVTTLFIDTNKTSKHVDT
ncbi:hypothetical protein DPMN_179337 [Dreissena polymorpha]|uniref:Uncharacterized protein n=1 Tax=Dreissena polymorpha TaxID=45954 RepID=A0A9D4IM24_DREPO|nr:hypothetical protein DPMN_179337 [Dreissena polymorpha]